MMPGFLFLIGYRGCGKTSVAHALAERLNSEWIDSDTVIETAAGKTIREIFETSGEETFRDLESAAIEKIIAGQPCIVALGGGAVLRVNNRQRLKSVGKCIWLQATANELFRRISHDHTTAARRPSLTGLTGYDEIVRLLSVREPIYRETADWTIDTQDLAPHQIAERIEQWLRRS